MEVPIYDAAADVVTIYGIRYSGQLFQSLALAEPGTWLRITDRKDGVIIVTRVAEQTERTFDLLAGVRTPCVS